VKAIWKSYKALWEHFHNASADKSRSSAKRAKYEGLKKILESSTFIENLGLLLDTVGVVRTFA
jgi:hypothetical protein